MAYITIAITGGRDYTDRAAVESALERYCTGPLFGELYVGDCPTGVDAFAYAWGLRTLGARYTRLFRADWDTHGKSAGPRRNQAMIDAGVALLLAFPGGRGTADCVRRARRVGVRVVEIGAPIIPASDLRALAEADHQPDLRAAHYVLADASGRYQTLPGGRRATPPKADHA